MLNFEGLIVFLPRWRFCSTVAIRSFYLNTQGREKRIVGPKNLFKPMKFRPLVGIILFVFPTLCGCAVLKKEVRTASPIPKWLLEKPPEEKGIFYEIGASPKTFFQKDAKKNAYEDALSTLSKRLKVEVKSIFFEIRELRGEWVHKETSVGVSEEVSDAVLYGAELIDEYYDEQGVLGEKESTYALIRWSEDKLKERIENILREYREKIKELQKKQE